MVAQSNATTVQGGPLYRRGQPWRRPPRRSTEVEVLVDEFPQAQALGKGGRQAVVGWPDGDTPGAAGTLTHPMP